VKRVTWRVVAGYVHEAGDVAGRRGFRSRNGWPGAADWVSRGSKRGGNADLGPYTDQTCGGWSRVPCVKRVTCGWSRVMCVKRVTWRVVAGYVREGGDMAGGRRFPSRNR
jgi:hypothetical protein